MSRLSDIRRAAPGPVAMRPCPAERIGFRVKHRVRECPIAGAEAYWNLDSQSLRPSGSAKSGVAAQQAMA